MPLLDLSLVTGTLQAVVGRRVKDGLVILNQPPAIIGALTVSALPPDQLTGDAAIGIYLYHCIENPALKNTPSYTQDLPPVQFVPMGLDLFYQVVAHSGVAGEPGAGIAQRLFGLTLKALRDFAMINKDTVIDGTPVFPTELQGTDNQFNIVLQTIPASEAPQYWTAGTQSVRLAAYYQVSAVLLEPEKPSRYGGRVLRYGVHTFVSGTPRLDASRSLVTFRVPGDAGDTEVEVQPAEAPVGGQVVFSGIDLVGDQTTLLVKNERFTDPVEVGLDWGVSATNDSVFATVQPLADTNDVLPGVYSAMVKVDRRLRTPDGRIQNLYQSSNEVPFIVAPGLSTPSVATVATADANGIVVVQGRIFKHPALSPDGVKVLVGPGELPLEPTATLNAGNFEVVDGTTLLPPVALDDPALPFVIRFRFPIAGLNSGDTVPLRVVVNGAENSPRWVNVP